MKILNNQLHELNLSCNMFRSLPNSVLGLYNLTTLDLRNNQLEDLPLEINTLKALRELIIADNRLMLQKNFMLKNI
jgi:Leucine-rich repeat (LRR) protein